MMDKRFIYPLLLLLLTACSTTKFIPDGEQLYTGIKSIDFLEAERYAATPTGETAMEEVTYALDCAPNGSIAGSSTLRGIPVGLWWYNWLHKSESKIGKCVEEPFANLALRFVEPVVPP